MSIVGNKIAEGGDGEIYEVEYEGKQCIMKVMKTYDNFYDVPEINILCGLRSRFVLSALGLSDGKSVEGKTYVIVEKMDKDLDRMDSFQVHKKELLFNIIYQMIKGIDVLHTLGYVHSDVKLSNFLVRNWNTDLVEVKISDFGRCKQIGRGLKLESTHYIETPEYAPPELYEGGILYLSKGIDIWALGISILQLLDPSIIDTENLSEKERKIKAYNFGKRLLSTPREVYNEIFVAYKKRNQLDEKEESQLVDLFNMMLVEPDKRLYTEDLLKLDIFSTFVNNQSYSEKVQLLVSKLDKPLDYKTLGIIIPHLIKLTYLFSLEIPYDGRYFLVIELCTRYISEKMVYTDNEIESLCRACLYVTYKFYNIITTNLEVYFGEEDKKMAFDLVKTLKGAIFYNPVNDYCKSPTDARALWFHLISDPLRMINRYTKSASEHMLEISKIYRIINDSKLNYDLQSIKSAGPFMSNNLYNRLYKI